MNRKLTQCESCSRWNNKENKMKNRLWCMTNCEFRMKHQIKIATIYNRSTGSKKGELEHGKQVI